MPTLASSPPPVSKRSCDASSVGGWMLSAIADASRSLGGRRLVLRNPGNRELMLSGVAWLAGLDHIVASGGATSEVSRIMGLTEPARAWWSIFFIMIVPAIPIVCGIIVVWRRNRSA